MANEPVDDLLEKLRRISAMGFVPSLRDGPTGVGYTLETHLGIDPNVARTPDFKGIEIKAGRATTAGRANVRTTIFSQVPDWRSSPVKNARDLVLKYGYLHDGRQQLYCSVGSTPNTLGLSLHAAEDTSRVSVHHSTSVGSPRTEVVRWSLPSLQQALVTKHPASCFVKAQVRRVEGREEFHYLAATLSAGADPAQLVPAINEGFIELDFVVHLVPTATGGQRARDHGYLFKIWQHDLAKLFTGLMEISLSD